MTPLDKARKVKDLFDKEVVPALVKDFVGKSCEIYSQGSACSVKMKISSFHTEIDGMEDFGPTLHVFATGDLIQECQHEEDKKEDGCASRSIQKHGHLKRYIDGVEHSLKTKESVESVTQFLSEEVTSHIWV